MIKQSRLILLKAAYEAFLNGSNILQVLASKFPTVSQTELIEISYSFQSGTYITYYKNNVEDFSRSNSYICSLLEKYIPNSSSLENWLDLGIGEGTTIGDLHRRLNQSIPLTGTDSSLNRLHLSESFLSESLDSQVYTPIYCRHDTLPFSDSAFEIVSLFHSLEPNKYSWQNIISEVLRVSARYVLLVEPIYEFANAHQRRHITSHNYFSGLITELNRLSKLSEINILHIEELLENSLDPLLPSTFILIEKAKGKSISLFSSIMDLRCIVSNETPNSINNSCIKFNSTVYPIVHGVPLLTDNNVHICLQ